MRNRNRYQTKKEQAEEQEAICAEYRAMVRRSPTGCRWCDEVAIETGGVVARCLDHLR